MAVTTKGPRKYTTRDGLYVSSTYDKLEFQAKAIAFLNKEAETVFHALRKIADRLTKGKMKYQILYLDNPKVASKLLNYDGALEFLHLLGFEQKSEILVCDNPNIDICINAIIALNRRIWSAPIQFQRSTTPLGWTWTDFSHQRPRGFYSAIALEVFGVNTIEKQMEIQFAVYRFIIRILIFANYIHGDPSRFDYLISDKVNRTTSATWLDMLAISALYNVRIVVHEYMYNAMDQIYEIKPTLKTCSPSVYVPVILLTKAVRHGMAEWGVIHQMHDIAHLIWPNMELNQYLKLINEWRPNDLMVRCVCNQWMENEQISIPVDILDLIIRYWPTMNVRPIQGPIEFKTPEEDLEYYARQIAQNQSEISVWMATYL